jgi:hypothetical protein
MIATLSRLPDLYHNATLRLLYARRNTTFCIAVYDTETRRVYVRAVSY